MSDNGKDWLNDSGCPDPTAYSAIKKISQDEHHADQTAFLVVRIIKDVLELAGFELLTRIQIRHKKSGRNYR